jgi:hypothetical protein
MVNDEGFFITKPSQFLRQLQKNTRFLILFIFLIKISKKQHIMNTFSIHHLSFIIRH